MKTYLQLVHKAIYVVSYTKPLYATDYHCCCVVSKNFYQSQVDLKLTITAHHNSVDMRHSLETLQTMGQYYLQELPASETLHGCQT